MSETAEDVKVTFRMPEGLRRRLKAQAAMKGMTSQEVILKLVEGWVSKKEQEATG